MELRQLRKTRKKAVDGLTFAAIILFAAGLIVLTQETSAAAVEGLEICANILIPSLFPFFVISSMAVKTGLAHVAGRAFEGPMRFLFGVPGACAPAFILGLVGGYPVGARTAISLFEEGLCSRTEAERLLSFCNNSGPAFILGAVGAAVFGATSAGVLLYGSHVLASITVGILFRFYKGKEPMTARGGSLTFKAEPLGKALTASVTSSFSSVLNVCAFVIFFSVAIRLLVITGVIPYAASLVGELMTPLGLDASFAEKLLSGIFEVTTGVNGLVTTTVSLNAKLAGAAFMLGWAGISVHCQVLNFIGESGLSTLPYLIGKLLHGAFSAAFAFAAAWLLPYDTQVSKALTEQMTGLTSLRPMTSFGLACLSALLIWLVFFGFFMLFTCKKRRKRL